MGVQNRWGTTVIYLLFLMLIGAAQLLNSQNLSRCSPGDSSALIDFMANLEPKPEGWSSISSSTDCCNWIGITCNSSSSLGLNDDNGTARVTKLELGRRRLTGILSDSLGKLDELRVLNLTHNYLKELIPLSLFNLPKLQALDLSFNDLSGSIPPSINLPSIQILDISSNTLNSSIPSHICRNSTQIQLIRLGMNSFSGQVLPGFGKCSSLEHLCLGMNYLTGNISDDIFHLHNLKLLNIEENELFGRLDSRIGNLSSLTHLDISGNQFSGEIPDVFHGLNKLEDFVAGSNRFIGRVPSSLANSPSLTLLNLRNNSLSGSIQLNCSSMSSLASLDLGSNMFNGSVPRNLPSCRQLKIVNLARNSFIGRIPDSFKNFESLVYLSLSNSGVVDITSALRILGQCRNLTTLVLTRNFLGEELPPVDSSLRFTKLSVLVIANCGLTGSIPEWLVSSTNLQLLDLSWNSLTGTIPSWFGNYTDLFYLDLSNNSFTGEIPRSLTKLPNLINRNISLEDALPDVPFFVRRDQTEKGLQYNQVRSFPPTLELSLNNLTGPIWEEFGNLRNLIVFDLKRNKLSGVIPSSLSGMRSLEILDFSGNSLMGSIPFSLQNLSFLSKFSVADNKLTGVIPSEGQFQTFPNSSFEGNTNLCGVHWNPCSTSPPDDVPVKQVPVRHSKRSKDAVVGMVVGIVSGTGFLLTLLVMIVLRAYRREAVDPEKENNDDGNDGNNNGNELEEVGPRLVVLFQNKETTTTNKDITIDDILKATNNFDQANIVGCGGFGLVYRATLPDGTKAAIKRLSGDCFQMDREFRAEVETLSRARHPNLVPLLGYCMHKNDRLLIYRYMENSSLDYWLHEKNDGPSFLDWDTRLRIARGAARGLDYLHQSCEPHILHRDIKSSNILLNEKFEACLSDFGLARLILPYDTHVTTDLVGTLGYIPPEYSQASFATYKGDVYSFGVVLLELLTGKRPMNMCKPKGSRDLISWVIRMSKENKVNEVFDTVIYGKQQRDTEMLQVLEIACRCLNESPKIRPTMQQIVSWLDSINASIV